MLFLAVAGALLVPQAAEQDFARVVSFAHTAAPLKRVLPKLGQVSGLTLTVSSQLENEVLLIEFDRKPISEVLKNIATVTHAGWVQSGNSIELQRSPETQEELARRSFQVRVDALRRSLGRQLKNMGSPIDDTKAQAMVKEAARIETLDPDERSEIYYGDTPLLSPEDRLVLRLVSLMDMEWLASLAPGQPVVLTSDPQYPELQLPDVDQLIRLFVAETRALSVAAGRQAHLGEPEETIYPWILFAEPLTSDVTSCRLILVPDPGGVYFELELGFTRGIRLATLGLDVDEAESSTGGPALPRTPSRWQDVPVAGLGLLQLEQLVSDPRSAGTKPTAEQKAQALNLTVFDPLGFLLSDVVRYVAAKDGLALCALLPDAAGEVDEDYGPYEPTGETPDGFYLSVLTSSGVRAIDGDAWRLISPIDPILCEASRMPRELAEQKIRYSISGGLSLRQLSQLCAAQPRLANDLFYEGAWLTGQATRFIGESWLYDDPEYDALRFLAGLNDLQYDGLRADGLLSASDLDSGQQETLLFLLLKHGYFRFEDSTSENDGPPSYKRFLSAAPGQVRLELVTRAGWHFDQLLITGAVTPAYRQTVARRLNMVTPPPQVRDIKYRAAKTVEYDLQVRFPDGSVTGLASGIWLPVRMPEQFVPVSELPRELLQLIEVERSKLDKQEP